jgi:hypothetical protein
MIRETRTHGPHSRSLHFCFVAGMVAWTVAAALLPAEAALAVLQPGDPAPPFVLKDVEGHAARLDSSSTSPTILVFVKPGDKYTSDALESLDELFGRRPELAQGLIRWIVCSRMSEPKEAEPIARIAGPRWMVLLDSDDRIYEKYRIVATPTVVLVGRDRLVKAANPGYDPNMENYLHEAIAKVMGLPMPRVLPAEMPKSEMSIQMGRRMAARGQYERALAYYKQAAQAEKLSPEVELEMAAAEVEARLWVEAEEILGRWRGDPRFSDRVADLQKRMETLKANKGAAPKAPSVTR